MQRILLIFLFISAFISKERILYLGFDNFEKNRIKSDLINTNKLTVGISNYIFKSYDIVQYDTNVIKDYINPVVKGYRENRRPRFEEIHYFIDLNYYSNYIDPKDLEIYIHLAKKKNFDYILIGDVTIDNKRNKNMLVKMSLIDVNTAFEVSNPVFYGSDEDLDNLHDIASKSIGKQLNLISAAIDLNKQNSSKIKKSME